MRLSTKVRYAVRAMLDLTLHAGGSAVSSRDVAERQAVSEKYMGQLLAQLRTTGLVRSVRGQGGGYRLARTPEDIRLLDIVLAFEGSMAPVECVDDPKTCERASSCAARQFWCELKDAVEKPLRKTTLAALAGRQRKLTGGES